ncbi:MAG: BCCT family transporter [Pseudomonadota bacterium]
MSLQDADPGVQNDYDTEYEVGQDNVELFGMDIHNPVFFLAAGLISTFCIAALAMPDQAAIWLGAARNWVVNTFDWFFVSVVNLATVFCVAVAVSPLGKIRLGGADAKPEFSTRSWLAMLFASGVGIGMVYYGSAEPLTYFMGSTSPDAPTVFGTPLNVEPLSDQAEAVAMAATIFHWAVAPWAVYGVVGLALAYFAFNRGLPLTIRSAFYPLLGDRVWGWPGHLIDLLAVIATLFGLATSLGLGARQAAAGIGFLFDIEGGLPLQVALIAFITSMAIISVVRGLDGGVKVLSNINIAVAIALLTFVIIAGPTGRIIASFGENLFAFVANAPALANPVGRETDTDWYHGWTVFYWAWWISWSPFVGMFIARVSKGRSIREFIAAVLVVPLIVVLIWFSAFGETAIDLVEQGVTRLGTGEVPTELVLFNVLQALPWPAISSSVAIVLLIVFFVTSSDSGSLVIDSITAGGKLHAPIPQRVFWASMEGLVAIVLLVGGGATALSSLQAGAITAGLPFAAVLVVCGYSLYKGLRTEMQSVAETKADPEQNTAKV